ncbi:lamin tail domain-containing protein [Candidatus Woesearchaeota archaeon]|nr:lamin tail domain-containing protein [Candidatus Woesearchaeota archaeon]
MKNKLPILVALFFMLVLSLGKASEDKIIIAQVLYDPLTPTGGEAVELYNPTAEAVNLSGYVLATKSSNKDVTLPPVMLAPKQYFLIADEKWDETKDDDTWPAAEYEETMTLPNANSGVALRFGNETVDAVAWGESTDYSLMKGTPALPTVKGQSLRRKNLQNTGNNLDDFEAGIPVWKRATVQQSASQNVIINETILTLELEIEDAKLPELNLSLNADDLPEEGIQLFPIPGKQKQVTFSLMGELKNVTIYLTTPVKKQLLEFQNGKSNFSLNYFDLPGMYTLNAAILTKEGKFFEKNLSFEYKGIAAFEIEKNKIDFGKWKANTTTNQSRMSLKNQGNVPLHIGIHALNLQNGTEIKNQTLQAAFGNQTITIKNTLSFFNVVLQPGQQTQDLSFWFSLKEKIFSGKYRLNLGISAQP